MRAISLLLAAMRASTATPPGPAPGAAAGLFVSSDPTCAMDGVGSPTSPLCSLADALRATRNRSASEKTVVLRGGTHRLTEPLRLTAADSGLTLRAHPGEQPTVSGGVAVTGWASAAGGVWRAPLPAGLPFVPRQLYVNGARASRTVANATVLGAMNRTMGPQTFRSRGDARYAPPPPPTRQPRAHALPGRPSAGEALRAGTQWSTA